MAGILRETLGKSVDLEHKLVCLLPYDQLFEGLRWRQFIVIRHNAQSSFVVRFSAEGNLPRARLPILLLPPSLLSSEIALSWRFPFDLLPPTFFLLKPLTPAATFRSLACIRTMIMGQYAR